MGGKIMVIFFIVLALGIGLYVYNSGVIGQGFNLFQSLAPNASSSGSSSSFFSLVNPTSPNTSAPPYQGGTGAGGSGGGINPQNPPLQNPTELPPGFTKDQISPYFHEIRMGIVAPGNSYGGGQISFYASYPIPPGAKIDVTGWQIRGNHGGEYIPQAVNVYDALGLNPPTDIYLKSQDILNIYGSSAPVNLRMNRCMGYLPNKGQFTPALPLMCQPIDRAAIQNFSGACQNYILTLGGCQLPDFSNPAVQNDYYCRQYIENNFNYRSCVDQSRTDPNFLLSEVRVWMGSDPLDPYHDRVELLDTNGLLVDYYVY